MKKQATITRWDAARGFGFMRSADTAADVFFHVRDWHGGREGPAEGLRVVYEEIHVGGKGPRGMAVRPLAHERSPAPRRAARTPRPRRQHEADAHPAPALLLMLAYAALLAWCVGAGRLPLGLVLASPLLSFVTFFAYWHDKNAAQRGAWRTSEQTLHLLGLLGGWPGSWFAHRVLRHKSRKASFRATYWATVGAHWAALLAWLFSPIRA
jgi:uncharacterized membrane protein YsdA (DUF1294 family)/cold shock CspA family protein